jgi:hypothetical protein
MHVHVNLIEWKSICLWAELIAPKKAQLNIKEERWNRVRAPRKKQTRMRANIILQFGETGYIDIV